MAYSRENTSLRFPTYDQEKDPFYERGYTMHRYTDAILEGIPPGTVPEDRSATSTRDATRSEQVEDVMKTIQSELNEISEESSENHIQSWRQKCSQVNFELDIDRLVRFAICRNAIAVVKYLVDVEKVSLDSQDEQGRPASFYAMWDYPNDHMFKYIASKVTSLFTVRDSRGWGLIGYAVILRSLDAFEFLLTLLDPDDEVTDADIELWRDSRPFGPALRGRTFLPTWYVRSLIGCRNLIRVLPNLAIHAFSFRMNGGYEHRTTLQELRQYTNPAGPPDGIFWAQLPWGITFVFALRRYEKYLGYSTVFGVDWLPSAFQQYLKVPANPDISYIDPMYESSFRLAFEASEQTPRAFVIFPCFVLQSKESQTTARIRINNIRQKTNSQPTRNMLQSELTLDEAYFPTLPTHILNDRNTHQVVSQQCDTTLDGTATDHNTKPMLMVHQLWLWRCGRYIQTAFPEDDPETMKLYKVESTRFITNPPPSPGILTGVIIAHQISEFGSQQTNGQFSNPPANVMYPSPLDLFEANTAQILANLNEYMKLPQSEIEKETDFTLKIANVREELAIINQLLEQQLEILSELIEDFESYNPDSQSFLELGFLQAGGKLNKEAIKKWKVDTKAMGEWEKVKSAKNTIRKYQKRVNKIDEDAARVEKIIQDQLNLKRTHASIRDARASLTLGTAGLILSTAVIGFTLITIIFAPLAFVTALFALPIDMLLRNQVPFKRAEDDTQPTTAYPTSYVGTWFAAAELLSLVFTILLVILCVWLLRGTKSFSMLQGNGSGARLDEKAMAERGVNVDRASGQETTGLRRRVRQPTSHQHRRKA